MNFKNIITCILGGISLTSAYIASGIKEVTGWEEIARPFFIVWFVCLLIALIIANINHIRRYTYPAFICLLAWLRKYNIYNTKFSTHAYRVYRQYKSFSKLYTVVQNAFDYYIAISAKL